MIRHLHLQNTNFHQSSARLLKPACKQMQMARPTAEQLLSHPFTTKYEDSQADLGAFARSVFDPTQSMMDSAV
ncbi:hypothetical protein TB1_022776 [Malus domestica]